METELAEDKRKNVKRQKFREDKGATKRNKRLDLELEEDKRENAATYKLLLLGSRNSGQFGVFTALTRDYLVRDRIAFKDKICSHIIEQMKLILESLDLIEEEELELEEFETKEKEAEDKFGNLQLSPQGDRAAQYINEMKNDAPIDENVSTNIEILWKESAIQQVFKQRQDLGIDDSSSYYFNEINRIAKRKYIPTDRVCVLHLCVIIRYNTVYVQIYVLFTLIWLIGYWHYCRYDT